MESKNILLINNNIITAFGLAVTLRSIGDNINVTLFDDVDDTHCAGSWKNDYDLVLIDLDLPELLGHSFLTKVQDHLQGVSTAVFSSGYKSEQVERAFKLGANRYIPKCSEPKELKRIVSALLAGKHRLPIH